jgi:hypothetical protein
MPRYTPGSPGMVSEQQAYRVAYEERAAFEHCKTGVYGASLQARAQRLGLSGIAERRIEHGGGWLVIDLVTGDEVLRVGIKAKKLQAGDTVRRVLSGAYTTYDTLNAELPMRVEGTPQVIKHAGRVTVIIDSPPQGRVAFEGSSFVQVDRARESA